MATIDPSIALGIKPLQLDNPMNAMAMYSQIQGAQQANQLNRLKMDEYERARTEEEGIRNYLANTKDVNAPETRAGLLKYGKTGLEYGKALTEQQKAAVERQTAEVKLVDDKLKQSRNFLEGIQTADQYLAWHEANHRDPVLGPMLASRGITADQSRARIMGELSKPGGLQKLINESKLGVEKFAERNTMTAYEQQRINQEQTRLNQEATSVVYQQDANGNIVALPSKLKAGEMPKARTAVAPGAGMTPLEGKPSEAVAKERGSINQQKSIISNAIKEVQANPDAFGTGRGMLGAVAGESAAGKMYETPQETQARAFLFNTVSNVIHERAGTAQSAGERDTLMRFLPSEFDNDKQIVDKLKGYEKFLAAKESGTGHRKSEAPSATGNIVKLPNGSEMTFPDAAAAAAFKKAAGL
jgi:hypothetical protein